MCVNSRVNYEKAICSKGCKLKVNAENCVLHFFLQEITIIQGYGSYLYCIAGNI